MRNLIKSGKVKISQYGGKLGYTHGYQVNSSCMAPHSYNFFKGTPIGEDFTLYTYSNYIVIRNRNLQQDLKSHLSLNDPTKIIRYTYAL